MADLIKEAFGVLKEWPLVQGAVAVLVLVIATLLAWSAVKKQLPQQPPTVPPSPLPHSPAAVPVQIESPWLVQHLVEMHLDIERIKNSMGALEAKLDTNAAAIAAIITLLRRRANRQGKQKKS